MRLAVLLFASALLGLPALPAAAASVNTARSSAVEAVRTSPHSWAPIIDKLAKNERVRLDFCTREALWCHVIQLDGGPSGWVDGTYLVGSPAKAEVTPFQFSFNLWPRGAMNFELHR